MNTDFARRQMIAQHMIASRATSAHAQTVHEIDFSAVVAAKKALAPEFAERGVKQRLPFQPGAHLFGEWFHGITLFRLVLNETKT